MKWSPSTSTTRRRTLGALTGKGKRKACRLSTKLNSNHVDRMCFLQTRGVALHCVHKPGDHPSGEASMHAHLEKISSAHPQHVHEMGSRSVMQVGGSNLAYVQLKEGWKVRQSIPMLDSAWRRITFTT
jgi:hypothetical protein